MEITCKGCSLSFKDQHAYFMHFLTNLCVAKQPDETDLPPKTESENNTVLDLKHLRSEGNNVCEVCGKYCWSSRSLAQHIITHVGAMPFFCPFCTFSSLSKLHLETHFATHGWKKKNLCHLYDPSKAHVCDICSCACKQWQDLAMHYVKHLKEAPFKCDKCFLFFLTEHDFCLHNHLHKNSHSCEFCQTSFDKRVDFLDHVLSHNLSKMFRKFSLVVPYERLMRLRVSWYRDFFASSQCPVENPIQLQNLSAEDNNPMDLTKHKKGRQVTLNYPSIHTVSPQPLFLTGFASSDKPSNLQNINYDGKENEAALSKAALENPEGVTQTNLIRWHNLSAEDNIPVDLTTHKKDKLDALNYPSVQTVSPQPLFLPDFDSNGKSGNLQNINYDGKENGAALSKAALENPEDGELIVGISAKPPGLGSPDCKKLPERTSNPFESSNNLKAPSKTELNANVESTSEVGAIASSAHPINCSNARLKPPVSNSAKLQNYLKNVKSSKSLNNLPSQQLIIGVQKLPHQKKLRPGKLNKNSVFLQFMQPTYNHTKPVFDYSKGSKSKNAEVGYSKHNKGKNDEGDKGENKKVDYNKSNKDKNDVDKDKNVVNKDKNVVNKGKNDEVEIREDVAHLCEVLFDEGSEDVSLDSGLSEKLTNCVSASEKTSEASLNPSVLCSTRESLIQREVDFTDSFLDDGDELIEIPDDDFIKQQLNCYFFNEDDSGHEVEKENDRDEDSIWQLKMDEMCVADITCDSQNIEKAIHFNNMFQKNKLKFDYQTVNFYPSPNELCLEETPETPSFNYFSSRREAKHGTLIARNRWRNSKYKKSSSEQHKVKENKSLLEPHKNEVDNLLDLVKNLKEFSIVVDKLPSYVCNMPSFRMYMATKKDKNISSVNQKDYKLPWINSKSCVPPKRTKTNPKKNPITNVDVDYSPSDDSIFSDSFSSADEMCHPMHRSLERKQIFSTLETNRIKSRTKRAVSKRPRRSIGDFSSDDSLFSDDSLSDSEKLHYGIGTRKKPRISIPHMTNERKRISLKFNAKPIPGNTGGDSSATDSCSESFSDSSSGISDFMQRWLMNYRKNSVSPFAKAKKSVPKQHQKLSRKQTRKPETSLCGRKPFVHLCRLPKSIYEKHRKGKPIMLSSLPPMIDRIEGFREFRPAPSEALQDHTYCFPTVSASVLLDHNYC